MYEEYADLFDELNCEATVETYDDLADLEDQAIEEQLTAGQIRDRWEIIKRNAEARTFTNRLRGGF